MAIEKSINPSFSFDPDLNEFSVDQIIDHTEWLMIWYCRKPSIFLANLIVSSLEMLISREDCAEPAKQEWASPRLLKHWAYIAENSHKRA